MRISSQKLIAIAGRKHVGVPLNELSLYFNFKGKAFLKRWNATESPTRNNLALLLSNGSETITSKDLGISE